MTLSTCKRITELFLYIKNTTLLVVTDTTCIADSRHIVTRKLCVQNRVKTITEQHVDRIRLRKPHHNEYYIVQEKSSSPYSHTFHIQCRILKLRVSELLSCHSRFRVDQIANRPFRIVDKTRDIYRRYFLVILDNLDFVLRQFRGYCYR